MKRGRAKCDRVENMFWEGAPQEFREWMLRDASERVSRLGLSPSINSHKRARRGSKGITSYGAKLVRNAAFLLQKRYGRRRLGFITVTLPSLSQAELKTVAENWSQIVRVFFQRLKRRYESSVGRKFTYVAVTEIQEKRFEERQELGLHIHFVYVGKHTHKSAWVLSSAQIRDDWRKTLENYVDGGIDYSAVENCKCVRKDAEGYLGKYLSKGCKSAARLNELGYAEYLPSAWYSLARSISRAVRSRVTRDSDGVREFIREMCKGNLSDRIIFWRHIEIELPMRGDITIGYMGKTDMNIDNNTVRDIIRKLLISDGKYG